jgi:hypoxanthine-DNA glycosylase
MRWIDTHCHLDAPEFDADRHAVVQRARAAGVHGLVLPAVARGNFDSVRALAHEHGVAYALGIHPLCVNDAADDDLAALRDALAAHREDPRLVAVGEIGLDHFVPGHDRERQQRFYVAQLKLARDAGLSAIWHVELRALPYRSRLAELKRRGLGLWDVYAACRREGSLDTSIEDAELNDFEGLAQRAPQLRAVAHNGGESARMMTRLQGLGYDVLRLPSTSPANASWSFERKLEAWRAVFVAYGIATLS